MIKAYFYCTITADSGKNLKRNVKFDEVEFFSEDELTNYCRNEGYELGEICGYHEGAECILTDIITHEAAWFETADSSPDIRE